MLISTVFSLEGVTNKGDNSESLHT